MVALDEQSPDIAQGVLSSYEQRTAGGADLDLQGAGDQGMMFGYACDETPELMPLPMTLAHAITSRLAEVRKTGTLGYLRPDGKAQVTVRYRSDGGRLVPLAVERLLISTQHDPDVDITRIKRDVIEHVLAPVMPKSLCAAERLTEPDFVLVNPTGRFVTGGPMGDTGLTGRKIIVDTYGGAARHGGGAFSGKDPSKVDRSAAYAARWVAKNIVAAGLAARAEVQVAYAIGVARPVSVSVETFGTERSTRRRSSSAVERCSTCGRRRSSATSTCCGPIYRDTAAYGHFGREGRVHAGSARTGSAELLAACGLDATAAV